LEDASFEGIRGLDRPALMGLALSTWIERGETVTLAGATGLGKTWLACALAQYACRQGRSALYLRVPRLAEDLRILHAAGSF
jgi:DNA replication protein DnaC